MNSLRGPVRSRGGVKPSNFNGLIVDKTLVTNKKQEFNVVEADMSVIK